jgi:hypothetical protein
MLERKEERNDMIKALIQNVEKIIIGKRSCIDSASPPSEGCDSGNHE